MNSNTAPMIILVIGSTLFLTVAAEPTIIKCKGVPLMPVAAACGKVRRFSDHIAELCLNLLQTTTLPANTDTTVYAYKALDAAAASLDATYKVIDDQVSHNASLVATVRSTYVECQELYKKHAMVDIASVKGMLDKCLFSDLVNAFDAVDRCLGHDRRRRGQGSIVLPLYERFVTDRDMTMLASSLVAVAANSTMI